MHYLKLFQNVCLALNCLFKHKQNEMHMISNYNFRIKVCIKNNKNFTRNICNANWLIPYGFKFCSSQ